MPEGTSDLGEVVAQLVSDMSTLKQELLGARWKQVADNFTQIGRNFETLHGRIEDIERRLNANSQ